MIDDLPGFLGARGIDFGDALASANLKPEDIGEESESVPLAAYSRLLDVAAEWAKDPTLGLHYSEAFPLGGSGAIGYAILNSPNVRSALETLARYGRIAVSVSALTLTEDAEAARLRWTWPSHLLPCNQLTDFVTAGICLRIRLATGRRWTPLSVDLDREAPSKVAEYHRVFGRRVRFSCPWNEVAVQAQQLPVKMPNADPNLFKTIKKYCNILLDRTRSEHEPLVEVREALVYELSQGKTGLPDVALRLGTSRDRLRRQLHKQGTSFSQLQDSTRRQLAEGYLAGTNLPVTEIAFLLGYSEQSAFSRAAQRWFGVSPRTYRKEHKAS
jgi:AraC-like DNA-binding protein